MANMYNFVFTSAFLCIFAVLNAAPLPKIVVDMTHVVDEHAQKYPIFKNFDLTVVMNGTFQDSDIWVQSEEFTSTTHAGTHMDAPSHFVPGGLNIDQLDVEHFMAPAAVIDITEKAQEDPDSGVTVDDLLDWELRTGQSLDGTIVLQRSGWESRYRNTTAYIGNAERDPKRMVFPGFEPEAAQWLVDNRDIKGVGVDTLSFDKGSSSEFLSHRILLGRGLFGLENVANVDNIPIFGAKLYVLPMKIARGSGAPVRIVATFPKIVL